MTSEKQETAAAGELPFSFTTELSGEILRCVITSPDPGMRYAVYVYDCEKDDHLVPLLKDPYAESTVRTYDLRKAGGGQVPTAVRVKVFARKGKDGKKRAILGERLHCASAVPDDGEPPFSFTTEIEGDILRCVITSPDPELLYACYVYIESTHLVSIHKDPTYARETVRTYDLSEALRRYRPPKMIRVKTFAQKGGRKWSALGERIRYLSAPQEGGGLAWTVTAELEGKLLRCTIVSQDPGTQYAVWVYAREGGEDRLLCEDTKWSEDPVRTYDLTEGLAAYDHPVDLFVRTTARKDGRKGSKYSGPITPMIVPSGPQILRPERPEDLPDQLPFSRWEEPFMDFCLVCGWPESDMAKFGIEGWHTSLFPRSPDGEDVPCWTISSRPMAETPTCRLLFSGMGRSDTMFLLGQDDAAAVPDPRSLRDTIGNFTMVYQDADQIYIGSDYFGVGKLFYYEDPDGRFVVSDRYHLLLLVLKRLGAPLRIDHEKWMADFWRLDLTFFQIWSRDMAVERTHVLPIDRCIEIDREGWHLRPSEIDSVLRDPGAFHPKEYEAALARAGEEIIDNVRVVYRNPKVRRISIDVTGGLDTRVVVAAWSHLTEEDKRGIPARMWNYAVDTLPEDAYVGVEIGRRAGLSMFAYPSSVSPIDIVEQELDGSSIYLGETTDYPRSVRRRSVDGRVDLYGAFGGACSRVVWLARWYYTRGDLDSIEDLVDHISTIGHDQIKIWIPAFRDACKRILEREISLIPGRTPCEKFDMHYLYYRNGTHFGAHFGTLYANDIETHPPCWGPIQSKSLFRLKLQTFHSFPEIKLEMDLIGSLSPEIADARLGNPGDVPAREALREKGGLLIDGYGRLPELDRMAIDEIRTSFFRGQRALETWTCTEEERRRIEERNAAFEEEKELIWLQWALSPVLDVIDGELGPEGRRSVEQWVREQIIDLDVSDWRERRKRTIFVRRVLHMYYLTRLLDA